MDLTARAELSYSGATYTTDLSAPHAVLGRAAAVQAGRVAGSLRADGPGVPVLLLPVGDGDPAPIAAGVFHHGAILQHLPPEIRAEIRPGGVWVRFAGPGLIAADGRESMHRWLDDHDYERAAEPWAVLGGDTVAEVIWPVRPVRDTPAFVGRHGVRTGIADPHNLLDADREMLGWEIDRVTDAIERLAENTGSPRLIRSIARDALSSARTGHLLGAGGDTLVRRLTIGARAALADLIAFGTGQQVSVELDGHPVVVRPNPGAPSWPDLVDPMFAAFLAADEEALGLLRRLPTAGLGRAKNPPDEYAAQRFTALRAMANGDPAALAAARAALASAEAVGEKFATGPWFGHVEAPLWRLAVAVLSGGDEAVATAQRAALLAHRRWWGYSQQNYGEPQDGKPEGFLPIGVAALVALHCAAGGEISVRSEYLPEDLPVGSIRRPSPSSGAP